MRKKSSYFFSAKKIARDVWNFCTSAQNCGSFISSFVNYQFRASFPLFLWSKKVSRLESTYTVTFSGVGLLNLESHVSCA